MTCTKKLIGLNLLNQASIYICLDKDASWLANQRIMESLPAAVLEITSTYHEPFSRCSIFPIVSIKLDDTKKQLK